MYSRLFAINYLALRKTLHGAYLCLHLQKAFEAVDHKLLL